MHRENNCFNYYNTGGSTWLTRGRRACGLLQYYSGKIGRIPIRHVKGMKRNQIKPFKKMAAAVV